jgi:hypothetical protein
MKPRLHPVTLLAALALVSMSVNAQSVPDFTGKWVLQSDKSNFGMVPAPKSRVDLIEHKEPRLSIKRTVTTADGQENATELSCAIDGQPCKSTAGPMTLTSVLRWDGQALVMATTTTTPQGDVTITDRFTLSADRQTLTQARTLTMGPESTTQTMVLARQP